ncbi:MAG TPA: NRDE family protein [Casimicrobiaceae bacterium]
MCLAVVALDVHPLYALVLAANRDEFHARPAQAAHWWNGAHALAILAGRDLAHGGTWLGLTRKARWAFVTNVRESGRFDPDAPSRGALVPALLGDARSPADALAAVLADGQRYNGFNVVVGDASSAAFGSNRADGVIALTPGIHGVSNAGLDTPWPKLVRAKDGVAAWIASGDDDLARLWTVLADRAPAADHELPDTGISRERERLLSSPFIVSETYGTRCSTLVALTRQGDVEFVERSFDRQGRACGEVAYRYAADPSTSSITRWAMPASSNTSPRPTKS